MMERDWKPISEPPPDGEIVETRVNDGEVIPLLLHRTLWWKPDHSVMAVAVPTHWRSIVPTCNFGDFNAVMPLLSVPENGTIVVAGAYRGDYLDYFSDRFPKAFLFGFEPQRLAFAQASKRLEDRNVKLRNIGLATATRTMFAGKVGSDGCSVSTLEGGHEVFEMADAVEEFHSIEAMIDLLVLNIEGGEWALLPYLMDEMMHHKIAAMAIQFHPQYVSPARAERVIALVDEYYDRTRFDYPAWCYYTRKGI